MEYCDATFRRVGWNIPIYRKHPAFTGLFKLFYISPAKQETSRKAETQIKSKIKSNYLLSDQYSFQERQHYQHIVANSKLHLKLGQ